MTPLNPALVSTGQQLSSRLNPVCNAIASMLVFGDYFSRVSPVESVSLEDRYLIRVRPSGRVATIPKRLTPRLAYFLGFFVGDGGLKDTTKTRLKFGKSEYKLIFGDPSFSFVKRLRLLFLDVFGFSTPVRNCRAKRGEKFYYLDPTSKAVHLFLTCVLGLQEGKYLKYVPKLILCSDPSIQRWFLRGYFDAEGSAYQKYRRKMWVISVHAREHALLVQIQGLLASAFGVSSSRLYKEKTASIVVHENKTTK